MRPPNGWQQRLHRLSLSTKIKPEISLPSESFNFSKKMLHTANTRPLLKTETCHLHVEFIPFHPGVMFSFAIRPIGQEGNEINVPTSLKPRTPGNLKDFEAFMQPVFPIGFRLCLSRPICSI